jgi:predicted GNAT family acetyltransferase
VRIREHDGVESFLRAAEPVLLADEARHNLVFGICSMLADSPSTYPVFHLWTVDDAGETVAAATMTPPFNLVVTKPVRPEALDFVADQLHDRGVELPGVSGAVPEADRFADAWERLTGARRHLQMAQGIYRARSPRVPEGVRGQMRTATAADRELLIEWMLAFAAEALPEDAPQAGRAEWVVEQRLAGAAGGGFVLWEDGGPVSMAGYGGRTPNGLRIGPVYTPPRFRRRGYAGALVAHLTRRLLAQGLDYCFLYTDLANPTSNRIYVDVGFELVCESAQYAFVRPTGGKSR